MSDHTIDLPHVDLSVPPADGIVRVTFQPENKTVEFPLGTMPYDGHGRPMSFLDVAENYGVFLDHACGGVCACTTCHVYVKQGEPGLSDPEDDELDRIDLAAGPQTNSRLGCQSVIEKAGTYLVEIPAWNRNYVQEGKPAAVVAPNTPAAPVTSPAAAADSAVAAKE